MGSRYRDCAVPALGPDVVAYCNISQKHYSTDESPYEPLTISELCQVQTKTAQVPRAYFGFRISGLRLLTILKPSGEKPFQQSR